MLNQKTRIAFLIDMLDGQQQNGGFDQWITNPSGVFVRSTVNLVRDIRATEVSALLVDITDRLPDLALSNRQAIRIVVMQELSAEDKMFIYDCDERYEPLRHEFLQIACDALVSAD